MGEQFYMACILSLAALGAVIFLAWANGLHRFNPTWVVAANTTVIMVWVLYGATWFLRLCVSLERLLRILTGYKPEEAHLSLRATLQRLRQIYEELGRQ